MRISEPGSVRPPVPRVIFDLVAAPLASELGFLALPVPAARAPRGHETLDAELRCEGATVAVMIAAPWGHPARSVWRHSVHRGLAHGARWAICVNGSALCVFDVERAYARRFVEFDLAAAFDSERTLAVLFGLVGAGGLTAAENGTLLERVMLHSERHRSMVRRSLRDRRLSGAPRAHLGIPAGLGEQTHRHRPAAGRVADRVYRLLFLLFAEARGLVPSWHPIYRDSYTIEAVRRPLEIAPAARAACGRPCRRSRGWRIAAAAPARCGCRRSTAGCSLRLEAPLAASARLDDRVVGQAVLRADDARRTRGRRADLLRGSGGRAARGGLRAPARLRSSAAGARSGGTAPWCATRPAQGDGIVLHAPLADRVRRQADARAGGAGRHAGADSRAAGSRSGDGQRRVSGRRVPISRARLRSGADREGALTAADIAERDRADFRRAVAQRCLYGVDVNPMAVQLGAAVALAGDAGRRQAADISRSPAAGRQQPRRRRRSTICVRQPSPGRRRRNGPREAAARSRGRAAVIARAAIGVRDGDARDAGRQPRTGAREGAGTWRRSSGRGAARKVGDGGRSMVCSVAGRPQLAANERLFRRLARSRRVGARALPPHTADPLAGARPRRGGARAGLPLDDGVSGGLSRRPRRTAAGWRVRRVLGNPPWEMLRG